MFPLTPSNTAQTLGLGRSARLGRRATASAVIVGAAAIALLAFARTSANAAENSSRMAQEHHACAVVLGLDPRDAAMTAASGASIRKLTVVLRAVRGILSRFPTPSCTRHG